jgi:hypothetical protein
MSWRLVGASACTALSGCAIVTLMSMEPEQRAALFLVPADKAVIYVYRDGANDDTRLLALSVDGNPVGEIPPTKFLFHEVAPGHHTLASLGAESDSIELDTEAGKAYFVGQVVDCAEARIQLYLHTADPVEGRARVRALFRASTEAAQEETRGPRVAVACRTEAPDSSPTRL